MKYGLLILGLLMLVVVGCAQESVGIQYETEKGFFKISVDRNASKVEIFNIPEQGAAKELRGIYGLEKLKRLQTVFIAMFHKVDIRALLVSTPIHLVIEDSVIVSINSLLKLNINAISLQGCIFGEELVLDPPGGKIEYLEITNGGLTRLPDLRGNIKLVNFSYNKINKILEDEREKYARCDKVLLIGNPLKEIGYNFIVQGKLNELIPARWYFPQ